MRKDLKYKILLCLLAGSVLAANTAFAAEYTETISSGNENYSAEIKNTDGNGNYTYNFGTDAKLIINGESRGISLDYTENSNTNKIIINEKLDISVTNKDNAKAAYGIYLQGDGDKEIDRSGGGNINVLVEDSELSAFAMGSGVYLTSPSPSDNNVINIGNADIDVQVLYAKYGIDAYGICGFAEKGSNNKVIMGNGSINVTAESVASQTGDYYVNAYGIKAEIDTNVQTGDLDIEVTASGNKFISETYANGIRAIEGGIINTGNGDINVYAINKEGQPVYADGIRTYYGQVDKAGGKITVKAKGNGPIEAKGVMADGGSIDTGIADVTVETISGDDDSKSIGLYGLKNGEINFAGGSITAVADNEDAYVAAISAEDDSVINVNQGTNNRIVINGNVDNFGYGAINLNLNTVDSVLTGSIEDENGTLNLENDASWSATGYSEVNKLTMNQGNIYVDTPSNIGDITINEYSGVGNVIFKADNTDEDGIVNINTSSFIISDAIENSFINVGVSNASINTLDFNKAKENLNTLAGKVYYDGDKNNLNGKVIIKEGLITPEVSGDLLFDSKRNRGYVANVKQNSSTTTIDNIKNVAATAIVAWRQEDSTLSQRLGDLRESDGGQGIWVRMSRGEFNYDGQHENQYNFFQLGYDWARGNWHYGAAVSHNDGETTYAQGTGENRSTSLSLYGTWLGRNGHYADIVLKQGRLSNDFDIYTEAGHTHGDYDMWGTSLSGEYGRKIDLKDGWYVTPQAQMTLMRIGGEDFTTNNGIHVRQDSLESAVGRVGFEVGKAFDKKGSIYAKASLLHDFAGSADTYLSLKGLSNSYSQDIGDTWWEAGLGFNYKVNDSSYLYADVVKTFGGDVETPWQWNVGMRWAFV